MADTPQGEIQHNNRKIENETLNVERRLYFPTYDQIFPLWICEESICEEFIRLFASNGLSVKLVSKPKSEHIVNIEKSIRGIRFDAVAETGSDKELQDYHIYCIDSQRVFMKESYIDRALYYGCVAVATKSLKAKESFDKLRPVTIIFIYIDNTASTKPIDIINIYKRSDIEAKGDKALPHTSKLNFVDINLNNKANLEISAPLDADVRAFMDIMSIGDDGHLVELILKDPALSDSTRKAIEVFRKLMQDKIKKMPIDESKYTSYMDKVLRNEACQQPATLKGRGLQ